MFNSLNDSKDVNILSGRPSDRLFPDISNTSRFFSEDILQQVWNYLWSPNSSYNWTPGWS